jgi:hypothetical protein
MGQPTPNRPVISFNLRGYGRTCGLRRLCLSSGSRNSSTQPHPQLLRSVTGYYTCAAAAGRRCWGEFSGEVCYVVFAHRDHRRAYIIVVLFPFQGDHSHRHVGCRVRVPESSFITSKLFENFFHRQADCGGEVVLTVTDRGGDFGWRLAGIAGGVGWVRCVLITELCGHTPRGTGD